MIDIKDLTLRELIIRRPDLIQAIKAGEDEGTISTSTNKDKDGKITQWIEEKRDLDGILISNRVDDYTYKDTGEIFRISMKRYDGENNLTEEKIVETSQ